MSKGPIKSSPLDIISKYAEQGDKVKEFNKGTVCRNIENLIREKYYFNKDECEELSKSMDGLKKHTITTKWDIFIDSLLFKISNLLFKEKLQFSGKKYTELVNSLEDKLNESLLNQALEEKNYIIISYIFIENNLSINYQDNSGNTLLHHAIKNNNRSLMTLGFALANQKQETFNWDIQNNEGERILELINKEKFEFKDTFNEFKRIHDLRQTLSRGTHD